MAAIYSRSKQQQLLCAVRDSLIEILGENSESLDELSSKIASKCFQILNHNVPQDQFENFLAGLAIDIAKILRSQTGNVLITAKKIRIQIVPQRLSSDKTPGVNEDEEFFERAFEVLKKKFL